MTISLNSKKIVIKIIDNIDLKIVDSSFFWKKDIKNLKYIITKENYKKLLDIGDNNIFYE